MAAHTSALARFARRVADLVAECQYAQRRMSMLTTSPNLYEAARNKAPGTYAEFLFRTSGRLLHEPAATGRGHGQPVG